MSPETRKRDPAKCSPAKKITTRMYSQHWCGHIDRLEETLSGSGTSHRVNGIAIQPAFIGPMLPPAKTTIPKTKRRSISHDELPLPHYNAGERMGPPSVQTGTVDTTSVVGTATDTNRIWMICRLSNQALPAGQGSTYSQEI